MDLSQTTEAAIQKHQPLQRKTEFCQQTASGLEMSETPSTSLPAELNSPHSTIPVSIPQIRKKKIQSKTDIEIHNRISAQASLHYMIACLKINK